MLKYETIILYVTCYGCGTLSPKIKEENGLDTFGNRVLRRVHVFETRRTHTEGIIAGTNGPCPCPRGANYTIT
jgi:hypothetical protein